MNLLAATILLLAPIQEKKIEWRTDYPAALADAKKTGRLVLVLFSGDF